MFSDKYFCWDAIGVSKALLTGALNDIFFVLLSSKIRE